MPKLPVAMLLWFCMNSISAAEMPFRVEVTVDLGADRGQNLGSLFEVTDARGRVVMGAGFPSAYNTYVRGERTQLQFFIRSKNGRPPWKIERLPPVESKGTGFYPLMLDGQLYVYPAGGSDRSFYRWAENQETWDVAKDVDRQMQLVAGKRLRRHGEQLSYDGVTLVDAQQTRERIGEYYYAQGNLFVRQFSGDRETGTNRVVVYSWVPEEKATRLLAERSDCTHRLSIPYEFFYTFAQWQDELIGITNVGTVLRFNESKWKVLHEPMLTVSYQVYCGINFYDKLLLGQYPSGTMFEYAGKDVMPLDDWPPVLNGVANSARELQTATIYGGDLCVGVWPWAEVWRYDADQSQWGFVQRMFEHPTLTDKFQHPYEAETKEVNKVANIWGQRVTGLMPLKESLIITTSSKGGQAWEPRFAFLSQSARADYGAIYRVTIPGNLAVKAQWKPKPTTFGFVLANGQLTISQDGRKLGMLAVDAKMQNDLNPASVSWGKGVFGPCTGKIVSRSHQ